MGPELIAALAAASVSIGTLAVGYLGMRSKASNEFVETIADRLTRVEGLLVDCEARSLALSKELVEAYKLAAEEVRRSALIEAEANMLRRELVKWRTCLFIRDGKCPVHPPDDSKD